MMGMGPRLSLLGLGRAAAALLGIAVLVAVPACSDDVIPPPKSDKNFDDPDEPATPGGVGAVDAGTADAAVACASDVDCPPKARRCFFPVADGCGAKGLCVDYVEPTGCTKSLFCACGGGGVSACAPEGQSPVPVQPGATCKESTPPDAGPDGASDAGHD